MLGKGGRGTTIDGETGLRNISNKRLPTSRDAERRTTSIFLHPFFPFQRMLDYSFPRLFSRVARQALTYPIPSSPLRHAHFPLHRLRPNPSLPTSPASGRVHPLFFFLNPFRTCAHALSFQSRVARQALTYPIPPSLSRMRTSLCTGSDLPHPSLPPRTRTPSAQVLTKIWRTNCLWGPLPPSPACALPSAQALTYPIPPPLRFPHVFLGQAVRQRAMRRAMLCA
jgi:hypothetical protein